MIDQDGGPGCRRLLSASLDALYCLCLVQSATVVLTNAAWGGCWQSGDTCCSTQENEAETL